MRTLLLLLIIGTNLFGQNAGNKLINGVFITNEVKYYDALNCNFNQLKTTTGVSAYFSNTPVISITPNLYYKAGTVKYNSAILDYDNSKKFYSETEVCNTSNQQNWKVSGNGTIPNMNFIYYGSLPSFNVNQNLVNDTLKKSDTLFIKINNIQNADSIMISISDNDQLSPQHRVALMAPNYANTYYLTPAIFASLTAGPRAVIIIDAVNYNYQTISGKKYLFRNIFSFARADVKIVN